MIKPIIIKIGFLLIFFCCIHLSGIAQTFEPFQVRKNLEVKGRMLVVGNNILGQNNLTNNNNSIDNQDISMQHIDIDNDLTTFNSSSADLVLPLHEDGSETSCYRVAYAALYWGAIMQEGDRTDINQIKFKTAESSTYVDITGEIIYDAIVNPIQSEADEPGNTPYACYANVTDVMTELTDIGGTYTVANIASNTGFNFSTGLAAGWTLFVIYEDQFLDRKSFTTFDGFSHIYDDHSEVVPVTGFTTPPAGNIDLQFAYGALDGDKNKRATKLEINGKEVTTPLRPANKFFGAVIENTNGISYPRTPSGTNTLGYDTGSLEILNSEPEYIRNNDTEATFALQVARGQADPIFMFFSAFAVDVIGPDIDLVKIVLDENGNEINGDNVLLGQNIFYEISYQNTGNDNITNFTITDILPENIDFDPNTDLDFSNAGGASLQSYDPVTRTLVFSIPDASVEVGDPTFVIRIAAQIVPNCYDLSQACSNEIMNQAFATYTGVLSGILIEEQASYAALECFGSPQPTNFLVDISNCNFERAETLCGNSVELTAAGGYDSYSWSTNPSGMPVIGTTQTITVSELGTYYVTNTTNSTCLSIEEIINVELYGITQTNPVVPYADELVTCSNDGKILPNIFLCGLTDSRNILTGISDAASIIWEQLDESSCAAVPNSDCANENDSCVWNQVATGPNYNVNSSGQFRLVINYPGGCFSIFYFNVYQNLLNPTAIAQDIICNTPGQITVNGVPSDYEYSIDGINYQSDNMFTVYNQGYYTVNIRQVGVDTNPCIFETPAVYIRDREFSVTSNVTQPTCNGDFGSISLAVNDALPQYYFSISQGGSIVQSIGPSFESNYNFTSLLPGMYTVTVSTDNGCFYEESLNIIEPPLLTVTAALTVPLSCNDGEITAYALGGTPPYVYTIDNSLSFQDSPVFSIPSAGTYTITVLDTYNCSASATINVVAILEPEFTITTDHILCSDETNSGALSVNVTNPNGNAIEYSIDGGATFVNSSVFTGLVAGNYDVVVQYTSGASICATLAQTVTITANTAISGTAELSAPFTCIDSGTISVVDVIGGDAPYAYSIDGVNFQTGNSFSGLTQGTYTITIRDANGCTSVTDSITVEALNPPTNLDFDASPVTCPANTSTITITGTAGGTGQLEYQIIAPSAAATPYQTSTVFEDLQPGTYTFQVRDENDCQYSESYTINPIPAPTLNVVLTEGLDCTATPDAVITGTLTGTAPFTYAVSVNGSAFTSLGSTGSPFTYSTPNAGTYQFEITDTNGCKATSSVVTVNPLSLPALSLVAQSQPILCNGDSNGAIDITIDTTVGTPPFVINVNNDTTGTNYGTQSSGLTAGTYTVTLTDANQCTATETVTIDQPDPILVDYDAIDITCGAGGVSQGSVIINSVSGGTAPYNYFVTSTNGYSNSELNATGSTSVSFDVVDFGLYQINIVDANGCSILVQDVLVASPPTDLDIDVVTTVDCSTGGVAEVSIGSTLTSSGPFFFSIYQGPTSVYPNPAGSWIPEDSPGSESATFTNLTPGVLYTFIVYDQSTNCSYYEPATTPIPTNSTLTATAVSANNISCTGSADGNVSFTLNSIYGSSVNVSYEIFDSLSLVSTSISGTTSVPANGTVNVTNLGPLPYGNYYVNITETSGPNAGCGIVTLPFNITESAFLLDLSVSVDESANCNANSGVVSAIASNGTAPYQYQITTTPASPAATDAAWASSSVFNVDAGDYYVHVVDAYGCVITSPVTVVPLDPSPVISATINDACTTVDGTYEIDVNLDTPGIAPYSFSVNGGAFQTQTAPFTISNLFAGVHTIEIQDANGCGNLISVAIDAPIELTPQVTAVPTCNNDDGEITLSTSGGSGSYTYSILPNPASISISGDVISGVPSGLYTITITDTVTSCTAEVTVSLAEAVLPTFTLTPITPVTCFGDNSGSFEININNYSGNYTYEVFDNLGASVTGLVSVNTATNPETVSGMESGAYSVVITQTDIPFCSNTANVTITAPQETLTLALSETSNVTCTNDQGTIIAIADGGWGVYEYELTGEASAAYSANNTFTNLAAGTYTVNARDAQGCIVSETITLTVPDPITATFTPSTTLLSCFGDQDASITVTNVTGGQGSNYTYTLNTILPTSSSSGPQTSNTFTDLGPGTYSVVITDGFECELTSLNIVIAQPTPIEASLVRATTQTCLTESTLTLSATGGTGTYEYSANSNFSTVLGSFSTSTTFSVTEGTYAYYVRDANACIASVSNEITVDPLPELSLNLEASNVTINCAGDNNGSIIASAQGGLGNYAYTLQDGSGNDITAVENSPGYFTELVAGTYVVVVESGDCIETSEPIEITEPSAPLDATLEINNVSCSGTNNGSIVITATGGTGIIKYAISPQLNQFFDTNTFENLAPGDYDIIVQDILGCYLTFNVSIDEPAPVILSIVANSIFPEVCEGDANGEFSIDISGGTLPYSVSLDDYEGVYTTGNATQTIFDFNDLVGGDHIVYIRDAEGCESQWNITFPESVRLNPEVVVENACENNTQTNVVTVKVDDFDTNSTELDYSLDGGPYQASNVFENIAVGSHYIDVRHTNGCVQTTDVFEVEDYDAVTLTLTEGDLNQFTANASGGTGDYQFTMNGDDYGSEINYSITQSGLYNVTVTDSSGCYATAQIQLEFIDICIPNWFTPNGDGQYDTWAPGCAENYPNLTFDIFDRYGRKVATYRQGQAWDGRYNGTELPTGDYWYVVQTNDTNVDKEFVGHFTLYR